MALEDRTVDLILKAEIGQALQPLADMVQQVTKLTEAIKAQQTAAMSGATSLTEYAKPMKDLKSLSEDLLKTGLALDTFDRQQKTVDQRQARVDTFRQARDAAVAAAPDEGSRSRAEQTAIDRRERALVTAERLAGQVNAQYARTVQLLVDMGVLSDKLAANQQRLAIDSARSQLLQAKTEAAGGLVGGREFDAALALRNAEAASRAEKEAGRLQAEAVRDAERGVQAALEEAATREAAAREVALRRAIGPARGILARGGLTAQADRQAAADAAETRAQALRQTMAAGGTPPTASTSDMVNERFAAIPDRAGIQAMGDATEAAEKLQSTLKTGMVTSGTYQHNMEKIYAVQRLIAQDAGLIDNFRAAGDAARAAATAFDLAYAEMERTVKGARDGTASTEQLTAAEQRLAAAATRLDTANAKQLQADAELKRRKIDTDNLTAATNKLVQASEKVAQVQGGVKQTGFLGLQPYQLKNLEYQIGDVYTQLSLGQGLMRTFNSQADQIFQLWDISALRMKMLAAYALPAAAALYVLYEAMARSSETIQTVRKFNAELDASVDGAAYVATDLTKAQRAIESFGVSFEDAGLLIRAFMRDGFDVGQMVRFGKEAQNLVDLYGLKFPDALKIVKTAITGTYDEIVKLNEEGPVRFLTPGQQESIRTNFDNGDAERGRAAANDALTKSVARATDALHPFQLATREVSVAWKEFLNTMDGAFKPINDNIASFGHEIAGLFKLLSQRMEMPWMRGLVSDFEEFSLTVVKTMTGLGAVEAAVKGILRLAGKGDAGGVPSGDPTGGGGGGVGDPNSGVKENTGGGGRGAVGMFQLRQGAAREVGLNVPGSDAPAPFTAAGRAGDERYDYEKNIQGGVDYFKKLLDQQKTIWDATQAYYGSTNTKANQAYATSVGRETFDKVDPKVITDITAAFEKSFANYAGSDKSQILERIIQIAVHESGANQYKGTNPFPTGVQPGQPGSTANEAQNLNAADTLRKQRAADRDRNARDDNWTDEFKLQVEEFRKKVTQEAEATVTAPGGLSAETRTEINKSVKQYSDKLWALHVKAVETAAEGLQARFRTLDEAALKLDKTDPAAQRAAIGLQYDTQRQDLQKTARQGGAQALEAAGGMQGALARINQLEADALEKATIDADVASVDAVVKTRDEKIKMIEDAAKTGGLSVNEALALLAKVIGESTPKVMAAAEKAINDLRTLPQTPKTLETEANIAKQAAPAANATAFETIDNTGYAAINKLVQERSTDIKRLNDDVANGRKTQLEADAAETEAYAKYKPAIQSASAALLEQLDIQLRLKQITPAYYDEGVAKIKEATSASNDMTKAQQKAVAAVDNLVEGAATKGFNTITTSIGGWIAGTQKFGDVVRSVGQAFAGFVADVLKGLGEMILKQTIMNALQSAGGAGGVAKGIVGLLGLGGAGSAAAGTAAVGATEAGLGGTASGASAELVAAAGGLLHGGGIAGSGTMRRSGIDPSVFLGAMRMHTGGLVGLNSNEVPTILQKGEEVLTASDARHKFNTASQNSNTPPPQSIRNVMLFDPNEVASSMAGAAGEKVVFNHIKRNVPALKQLIGSR